jgi:hypothetical protein
MLNSSLNGLVENRIALRHQKFSRSLLLGKSISIQSISQSRSEQIGNYRLLRNKNLTEKILIDEITSRCSTAVNGRCVLCIHDSSEANFFNHLNRLQSDTGLGPIDATGKKGLGFKMHNSLVLDAKSFYPYGLSNIKIWERDKNRKGTDWDNRKMPTKDKESSKWQLGCVSSESILKEANKIIHIQDREGDIYDQILDFKNDDKIFHVIRMRFDRITENGKKVSELIKKAKGIGQYELRISADSHGNRKTRIAKMVVKLITVKIQRPLRAWKDLALQSNTVTIIEVKETNPPKGIEALKWTLITNCNVKNLKDTLQVISWYEARWGIEEFFRILKKENFDIEASELETGWALRKLSIMTMDTSIKIFQIMHSRELIPEGETLQEMSSFSDDELQCLKHLNKKYSGATLKQQNPYKENSIQWVVWILSRMGGWKGYSSQRKPGATTILTGLERFYEVYSGWVIAKDVCTR